MKKTLRSHCPISYGLDFFGDKWSLLIVRDIAFKGKSSYGELLAAEEGIATNILSQRLRDLTEAGILQKVSAAKGARQNYALGPKGRDLVPLLVEIILWSAKHDKASAADKAFVKEAKQDRNRLLARYAVA